MRSPQAYVVQGEIDLLEMKRCQLHKWAFRKTSPPSNEDFHEVMICYTGSNRQNPQGGRFKTSVLKNELKRGGLWCCSVELTTSNNSNVIKDPGTSVKAIANLALGKIPPLSTCWLERWVWGQSLRKKPRHFGDPFKEISLTLLEQVKGIFSPLVLC